MQKTTMEFQSDWMLKPEFSSWLKPDRSSSTRFGFCSICQLRVRATLQHLRRHSTDRHSGVAPTPRPPRQRVPKFNPAWQQLPELSGWLQRSPRQPDSAFCVTCNKQLAPKLADLRAHAASALHLRRGGRSEVPHTGAADSLPPAELSLTATGRRARAETIEMWQKRPGFGAWLRRSAADWRKAFCLFCYIELPSKWVLLVRHNDSQRHRRKAVDAGHDASHPSDATEMLVLEATCDTDLPGTPWPDELGTETDQQTEQSNQDGADCETVTELQVMQPDAVNSGGGASEQGEPVPGSNSPTPALSSDAAAARPVVQFPSTQLPSPDKLTCHPPEDQLICLRPIDASDCPSADSPVCPPPVDQPDHHLPAETAADDDQSRTAPRSYTLLTLSPREAPNSPTAPCGDSKSVKPPRSGYKDRARYNSAWERHPELAGWLCRSSARPRLAYCRVCRRDVVPKLAHLRRHGACRKHARNALRPAEASLEEALTETGTADGGEDKLDHLPPGDTPDHHLSTEAATSHDDQSQLVQSDILVPPDPSPPEALNFATPTGGDSKSAKPPRSGYKDHARYNPAWERHPELAGWLCRSSARPRLANCRVCCRDVVPKLAHLRRHGACRKHARNILRVAEASMGETGNDDGDDGDEDAELELGQSIVVKTEDDTAAMDVAAGAEVAEDAEFSSDDVEGAEEPAEAAEDDDWEDEDRRRSGRHADGVSRSRPVPKLPLPRRRLMYLTEWESVPELRGWLSRSPWDERRPFCRWCHREVTPKLAHLRRHARSLLHKRARRGRAPSTVDESETVTEREETSGRAPLVDGTETVTGRDQETAVGHSRTRHKRRSRTAVDGTETTSRGREKMKEKEETLEKGGMAAEAVASNDATTAIQDSCRRAEFGPFGTCLVCKHPLVMRLNIFRSVTRASRRLVAAMLSTMVQRPLLEEDCDPSLSEICTACAALVDEADELQTKLAAIENNVRFKFASPRPLAEDSSRHWEDGSPPPEDAGAGPYGQRGGGSGRGGGRAHAVAEETMQAAPATGRADLLQEAVAFVTLGHTGEKTSRMVVRTDTLQNGDLIIYQEPVELLTQSEPPDDDMFSSSPQQRMGEDVPQHGASEVPSEHDAKPPAGRRRAFECPFCAGHFSSSSALHRHWTREHPQRLQLACPHCPERFLYSTSLRQHVRTHQPRQHVCQVCGKRFTANCDLRKHALFAHSGGERRHACDVCGRAFTLRWMLRRHERRVHAAGDAHDDK